MTMIVDGKEMTYTEYHNLKLDRQMKEAQQRWAEQQEGLGLLRRIGDAYQVYRQFIQDHPHLAVELPEDLSTNQKLYEQLQKKLELADEAPRCQYIKADGIRCGSPRMKEGELCYAHHRMAKAEELQVRVSNLEDANSVQLAVSAVLRALAQGQITEKRAALFFYGLQTAASNVPRLTFHKAPEEMAVEETPVMREQEPEQPKPGESERYRYENLDPDLRLKFNELDEEVDRRYLAKMKAEGRIADITVTADIGGDVGENTSDRPGGGEMARIPSRSA
ncbi:MAG TPA: hypothetical protein VKW06_01140 [Candidatus Angelobacter sp.]|nr:hypothetical protein [Candidatus Angelobacter sp.]